MLNCCVERIREPVTRSVGLNPTLGRETASSLGPECDGVFALAGPFCRIKVPLQAVLIFLFDIPKPALRDWKFSSLFARAHPCRLHHFGRSPP